MKILIVDDLVENRKLLLKMLDNHGDCMLASSGEDALEMFTMELETGEPFDLVLLDIMMPGMDGQEVLKTMRAEEERLGVKGGEESVIIMISALDTPAAVNEAFFKGMCTDYLAKPVDRTKLLQMLKEYRLLEE